MNLKGKNVVVIGGSSGMGLATAQALIDLGAHVTIAGRSPEKLKQAQAEISGAVNTGIVDITDESSVKAFFSTIKAIDHLVITAATVGAGSITELSVEDAKTIFENKFWGSYMVTKYALPLLAKEGSVVYFSGMALRKPISRLSAVTAACGAIEGLTVSLAKELAPIRFNAISPGRIVTPLLGNDPETKHKDFIEKLPIKKLGSSVDIAQGVIYLLSNSYVTGQILNIDGGAELS